MSTLDFLTYQSQAIADDWEATYQLGLCYNEGNGTKKDTEEAFKHFLKAAEHGHAKAQNEVAVCYECGRGIAENNSEALYWHEKAASQHNPQSLYRLACFYLEGTSLLEKNNLKGLDFLIQAYKAGLKEIECNLTFIYDIYKNTYSQYKVKLISKNHIKELERLVDDAKNGDNNAISIINSLL